MVLSPLEIDDPSQFAWDDSADVLVAGFGAAGACAALQAQSAGADVMLVDKFEGVTGVWFVSFIPLTLLPLAFSLSFFDL